MRGLGGGFVYDYLAGFHYPADAVDGYVDVGERVAFDGDQVGVVAGGYGAEFGGFAEEFCGVGGGGAQGLLGSHARFDEPAEPLRRPEVGLGLPGEPRPAGPGEVAGPGADPPPSGAWVLTRTRR